jgi:hypothetical protein
MMQIGILQKFRVHKSFFEILKIPARGKQTQCVQCKMWRPSQAWWRMPVIPATWEVDLGKMMVQGQLRKKS